MSQELIDRLMSRKFWAFGVGVAGSFCYAFGLIDEKGLAAIIASVAAYNVGEGLADFGQSRAQVESGTRLGEAEVHAALRRRELQHYEEQARVEAEKPTPRRRARA